MLVLMVVLSTVVGNLLVFVFSCMDFVHRRGKDECVARVTWEEKGDSDGVG